MMFDGEEFSYDNYNFDPFEGWDEGPTFIAIGGRRVQRSSDPKVWTTASGQNVRVKDMTDSHLVNTVDFLRREASLRYPGVDSGSIDYILYQDVPQWRKLMKQCRKRGIQV